MTEMHSDFSECILEWKSTQPVLSGRLTSKLWKMVLFFKVVECFEIVTDFCSPSTSFLLLAGPCPVSLAFCTWPQGRCERTEERGVTIRLLITTAQAFLQPERTAVHKQRIWKNICWGVPQPGDLTGTLSGLQEGGKLQLMWWELRRF